VDSSKNAVLDSGEIRVGRLTGMFGERGHSLTGERYEELFERISTLDRNQDASSSPSVLWGRQSRLFRRNEVASESMSPISTSATIRPPMGPRR
jgi:hypothetical protein